MNVFGKSFEFDGVSSDVYNIMLCSFDIQDNIRSSSISYTVLSGDITPSRPVPNFYNKKYADLLKFKIEICKKCETNETFTTEEQRKLIRWLTSPIDYRKFKIVDYEDCDYHVGIDYYCMCTNYGETVIKDNIVGMFFEFQCNAPYAFMEEEVIEFISTSSTSTTLIIDNKSDELEEDYYPVIELTGTATGVVTITNNMYPDEIMELNVLNGQTLCINNDESDISDNMDSFNYATDTNLVWLRLVCGNNTITITGDCTGYFKCSYPRKVGV